jgi:hypothetical protein
VRQHDRVAPLLELEDLPGQRGLLAQLELGHDVAELGRELGVERRLAGRPLR